MSIAICLVRVRVRDCVSIGSGSKSDTGKRVRVRKPLCFEGVQPRVKISQLVDKVRTRLNIAVS